MNQNERTIVVTVCSGTACYILGGSHLLTLKDHLKPEHARRVMLTGSPCLNHCKDRKEGLRPPYVTVDGQIHSGLNLDEFKALVESVLEER